MTKDPHDMREEIQMWVASETKVAIAVFFRNNPGIIDTMENLAERLAIPTDVLARELEDHVRLGLVTRRQVGGQTVYMLNRRRQAEIEGHVERLARVSP